MLQTCMKDGLPDIKKIPTLIEVDAELCRRSFRYFLEQAWPILEPFRKFTPGLHTDAFCEHLQALHEGRVSKLVVCMPPRFGKSIILLAFCAWEWITEPWHRYMCISYNESLAVEHNQKCRNLILSPWYQERFGSSFKLSGDQNQKQKFENDHTGFRMASGLTGTLGKGGDRLFLDDPMSQLTAESEVERQWCLDFYDGTLASRLGYGEGTATVCVMQRLHQNDMAAHLIALGFDLLNLPNEFEEPGCTTNIGWKDPRKVGELLWLEGCNEEATSKLKMSPYYTSQFQQRPVPAGGNLIKSDWWRYYDTLPMKMEGTEMVEDFDEQLFAWDATFEGKETSDFVVGQLWGRKGANKYLIDQVRGRWDFVTTKTKFIEFAGKYPHVRLHLVENKANGPAIISELRGIISGILPVDPGKNKKEVRITAITPDIESGNVYLPNPTLHPWVNKFVEEASYFPKGTNDDQIDCAAYALLRFKSFTGANIFEFYRKQTEEIMSRSQTSR